MLAKMDESYGPDIGGLALITAGVLGWVWGLVRGNQVGWASPEVLGSLAAGALLVTGSVASAQAGG